MKYKVDGGNCKTRKLIICTAHQICSITMIKSRRMRWTGNLGHTGNRNAYKVLVGNLEGERTL
jgi:hypothetical protein